MEHAGIVVGGREEGKLGGGLDWTVAEFSVKVSVSIDNESVRLFGIKKAVHRKMLKCHWLCFGTNLVLASLAAQLISFFVWQRI